MSDALLLAHDDPTSRRMSDQQQSQRHLNGLENLSCGLFFCGKILILLKKNRGNEERPLNFSPSSSSATASDEHHPNRSSSKWRHPRFLRRARSAPPQRRLFEPDYRRAPFTHQPWWYPRSSEVLLIQQSWSSGHGFPMVVGRLVLEYLHDNLLQPEKIWPKIALDGRGSRSSLQFRQQAGHFADSIDFVVSNLHDEKRLEDRLRSLGAQHCQYISRGFRVAHWELFQPALKKALDSAWTQHKNRFPQLNDQHYRKRVVRVWGLLAVLMVRLMFNGFCQILAAIDQAIDQSQSSSSSKNDQINDDNKETSRLERLDSRMDAFLDDCRKLRTAAAADASATNPQSSDKQTDSTTSKAKTK